MNKLKLLIAFDTLVTVVAFWLVWQGYLNLIQWAIIYILSDCLLHLIKYHQKTTIGDIEKQIETELEQSKLSLILAGIQLLCYLAILFYGFHHGQFLQAVLAICIPFVFHFLFKKLV